MKRKGSERAASKKPAKKAAKDPNRPKRPASAFFVFMYNYILINMIFKLFASDIFQVTPGCFHYISY